MSVSRESIVSIVNLCGTFPNSSLSDATEHDSNFHIYNNALLLKGSPLSFRPNLGIFRWTLVLFDAVESLCPSNRSDSNVAPSVKHHRLVEVKHC